MTTEEFTRHYIAAAYFTETGDNDQPAANAQLTPLFKAHCWIDCRNFLRAYRTALSAASVPLEQAAHDLWLTRNGHGASFLDRPEVYGEALAEELTRVARAMGSVDADFLETGEQPA